ncbi:MAG: hypothetical protein KatS3mg118_3220 [Paracoccaceae bacterium]|nr:MAG: hypothetical protein KatS3mg118_3220 [Paracoccaceae bacterium]
MDLKDRICIVTGAASGIGQGIARRFVAAGAKVAVADLKGDAAEATARDLSAGTGQRHRRPDGCDRRGSGQCRRSAGGR